MRSLFFVRSAAAGLIAVCFAAALPAQMRYSTAPSDPYQHIYAIVPMVGGGTVADPKRPMFVPAGGFAQSLPAKVTVATPIVARKGVVGYHAQITDDGLAAIVEFIATDTSAFSEILGSRDARVQVFQKGIHSMSAMETLFKARKKDFSFSTFQTRAH